MEIKKTNAKVTCETCGKQTKDWYKCHKKYFCSLKHLEDYEEKHNLTL